MDIVISLLLTVVFTIPAWMVYRRWNAWVGQQAGFLRAYRKPRRFGHRSWATRSFVLDASVESIRHRIDRLPEISAESLMYRKSAEGKADLTMEAMVAMFPGKKLPTGIEVEWLDSETVELRCHPYAEWPAGPEDEAILPLRQRQRLAEQIVMYVERESAGGTRVGYEMRMPNWYLVAGAASAALVCWIAWAISTYALAHTLFGSTNAPMIRWIPLACAWAPGLYFAFMTLRLQSISVLDNLVSTFGEEVPTPGRADSRGSWE